MLESNSLERSSYCFNFYVLNFINALMKRGVEEFMLLFLPEDTTENADLRQSDCVNRGMNKTRGTVKAVFWIAVSIAATLAIGQLK